MTRPVEIISAIERRRRWTPEQKVGILDEAFRPGGSVAATADAHGVSRALIYLWRRQAREGGIPGVGLADPARSAFLPVEVASVADQSSVSTTSRRTRSSRERRPPSRIEITLRNGRVVTAEESIDPAILARIIAVLDAPEAS